MPIILLPLTSLSFLAFSIQSTFITGNNYHYINSETRKGLKHVTGVQCFNVYEV